MTRRLWILMGVAVGLTGAVASSGLGQWEHLCGTVGDPPLQVAWGEVVTGPGSGRPVFTYTYSPEAIISLSASVNGGVPQVLATGPQPSGSGANAEGVFAPVFSKPGRYRVNVTAEQAVPRDSGRCTFTDEETIVVARPTTPRFAWAISSPQDGSGDVWRLSYANDCSAYVARPMRLTMTVGHRRWTGSIGRPCARGTTFYAAGEGWTFEWDQGARLEVSELTSIDEGQPRTMKVRLAITQGGRRLEEEALRLRWTTFLATWSITSLADYDRCTETEDIAQVIWLSATPYCQRLLATASIQRLLIFAT
ncbi:MAG: hypothetical protein ACOYL4_10450 [Miltoncostaeaceae bacterium]